MEMLQKPGRTSPVTDWPAQDGELRRFEKPGATAYCTMEDVEYLRCGGGLLPWSSNRFISQRPPLRIESTACRL